MSDLNLKITSDISKAISSLTKLGANLKKLSKSTISTGKDLEQASKQISKSSSSFSKMGTSVSKVDSNMKKFTNTMNKNSGATRRFGTDANRTADELTKLNRTIQNITGGFSALGSSYAIGTFLGKAVQGASDVMETINLFNVSMGQFAIKTGNALMVIADSAGLDPTFLQQATANYSLLARSMGMTNENANSLAKSITNLGVDLSSLMNVPIEQVMDDLRSGLLGQTETVYKYGIDLTEASLRQEALRLGMEKSVDTMTQGEKMFLRYSVMIRQSSLAHGDFAKTIETPANQLRILAQQVTLLSRTIGTTLINALGSVLPYINGFVMALRVVIETIASLLGYETPKFENMENGFGGVTDSSNDLNDSIGDNISSTQKLQKEINKLTMGFDELNIIPDQTQPSTPSGGGTSVGPITGELPLPDLTEYNAQLENVRMKATEIRDKILDWLGITREVDEATGQVRYRLEDGYANLEKIRDIVGVIGVGFLAWKLATGLVSGISSLYQSLKNVSDLLKNADFTTFRSGIASITKGLVSSKDGAINLGTALVALAASNPTLAAVAGTIGVIGYDIYKTYQESEEFRTGLSRLGEAFGSIGEIAYSLFIYPLQQGIKWIAGKIWDILPDGLKEKISEISKSFERAFVKFIEWVDKLEIKWGDLAAVIVGIILLFTGPIGVAVGGIILLWQAVKLAIKAIGTISSENWEKFKEKLKSWADTIKQSWNEVCARLKEEMSMVKDWFIEKKDNMIEGWNDFKDKTSETWDNIKSSVRSKVSDIKDWFVEKKDDMVSGWDDFKSKTSEKWDSIKTIVNNKTSDIKDWFVKKNSEMSSNLDLLKNNITSKWESVKNDLKSKVDDIKNDFSKAFGSIKDNVLKVANSVINVWESTFNGIIKLINWVIGKVNKIKLPDWLGGVGINISTIDTIDLPKFEIADNTSSKSIIQESKSRTMLAESQPLMSNYSTYTRSVPQISQSQLAPQQSMYNNQPQDIVINLTTELDGDVIYRNQQKIKSQKGINFGNPAFAR